MAHVVGVLLAGGSGTRFWPVSRRTRPKQLLALAGEAPLVVDTWRRIAPLVTDPTETLVLGGESTERGLRELFPTFGAEQFLIETEPKNTAPCIAWAASQIARRDPNAIGVVLPTDQVVGDVPAFRRAIVRAVQRAEEGALVTLGIRPTRPETGFGYIETAGSAGDVLDAVRFVEKPSALVAEAYLKSGNFLWNAGIFVFRAADMVAAFREREPQIAEGAEALARDPSPSREDVAAWFARFPSKSIDYAILEHHQPLAVVPGDFGWSDLGGFFSAWELAPKDPEGNAAPAGTVMVDARENLVIRVGASRRPLVLFGVERHLIVETDDVLMVTPMHRTPDLRSLVSVIREAHPEWL